MAGRDVIFTILAIDRASHVLDKIGRNAEQSGHRFGKFGALATEALVGIAFAAGEALVKSVELGMKFQSSMEMIHTQARVSQKDVDALSGKVLDLAGKVGEGPESLSDALYHIESAFEATGITGAKAMALLETAAKGAKIGHADLVDVTTALNAAVASGIPGVKNFSSAMGSLNAAVGAGEMHMQDMADAFSTGMLATVKGYGLSLRDVSAALATFGDNNMRGQLAGNQLRMSMQALVMPIKGAESWLAKLGLTTTSMAAALRHGGMEEALGMMVKHLKDAGVSSKETGEYITHIFGRKAGTGLSILIDQFGRLESKYKAIDHASESFGQTWADQQKTLQQQWDQLKAGAEALLTKLGLKLIPILTTALPLGMKAAGAAGDGLSVVVKDLSGWWTNSLQPALQHAADVLMPAVHKAIATVSAAFRDHQGVVKFVQAAFQILGAIIVDLLVPAFTQAAKLVLAILGPAFRLIGTLVETVVIPAFKLMAAIFLGVAGELIHGAAWAFGWIPGLGPKLQAAAKGFDKFRDDVNAALNGITKNTVAMVNVHVMVNGNPVDIGSNGSGVYNITGHGPGGSVHTVKARASGGPVAAGVPYLVGENGPELFIPGPSGRIIPNGAAPAAAAAGHGRGGDVHVHVHMQNGVVGDAAQVARYISDVVRRANSQGNSLKFA